MKQTLLQAVDAAGRILMGKYGQRLQIEHKGEVDLVTEADRQAEEVIVEMVRAAHPDHDILAEEGDYELRNSEYCWVIDPLDGTTNFAHGFPWFAISIALLKDDVPILGAVYQPVLDELFFAERDHGAFLNDRLLAVSSIDRLDQALLATGFPYDRKTSQINNYDHFVNFQQTAQACRRPGVASLDLASTAAGRFDGYWEMKLKPWDIAAGVLLIEEAGGIVSDFAGGPVDLNVAEILASNAHIHQQMIDVLARNQRSKSPPNPMHSDPLKR